MIVRFLAPVLAPALPAAAMVPSTPAAEAGPAPGASPVIAAERDAASDARIGQRIAGIFSEIPSLTGVTAQAEEGVVTLAGSVTSAEASARAEAIARRVEGW